MDWGRSGLIKELGRGYRRDYSHRNLALALLRFAQPFYPSAKRLAVDRSQAVQAIQRSRPRHHKQPFKTLPTERGFATLCSSATQRRQVSEPRASSVDIASPRKIDVTRKLPVGSISVVTLIRTDTTLDHSQKAEKV